MIIPSDSPLPLFLRDRSGIALEFERSLLRLVKCLKPVLSLGQDCGFDFLLMDTKCVDEPFRAEEIGCGRKGDGSILDRGKCRAELLKAGSRRCVNQLLRA
jgi:hypothetical protein